MSTVVPQLEIGKHSTVGHTKVVDKAKGAWTKAKGAWACLTGPFNRPGDFGRHGINSAAPARARAGG